MHPFLSNIQKHKTWLAYHPTAKLHWTFAYCQLLFRILPSTFPLKKTIIPLRFVHSPLLPLLPLCYRETIMTFSQVQMQSLQKMIIKNIKRRDIPQANYLSIYCFHSLYNLDLQPYCFQQYYSIYFSF